MTTGKARLRAEARRRRRELGPEQRQAASASICAQVLGLPEVRAAGTVSAYAAARGEVDLTDVIQALLDRGRRVLLPRVVGDRLELAAVTDLAALTLGYRDIREPVGPAVAPSEIDVAILPGLAFDREGGRLGQGAGFFDRLLPDLRPDALRVGVAYATQVVARVPRHDHDLPVDVVVTEEGVARAKAPRGADRPAEPDGRA